MEFKSGISLFGPCVDTTVTHKSTRWRLLQTETKHTALMDRDLLCTKLAVRTKYACIHLISSADCIPALYSFPLIDLHVNPPSPPGELFSCCRSCDVLQSISRELCVYLSPSRQRSSRVQTLLCLNWWHVGCFSGGGCCWCVYINIGEMYSDCACFVTVCEHYVSSLFNEFTLIQQF